MAPSPPAPAPAPAPAARPAQPADIFTADVAPPPPAAASPPLPPSASLPAPIAPSPARAGSNRAAAPSEPPRAGDAALSSALRGFPKREWAAAGSGGARPIWKRPAFLDMFADCAGGARAGQPGTARPEGLGALGDAMALVAEVLEALNREGEVEALRRAEEGFRQGIEAMEQLRSRREHAGLLEFLTQVVPMVSEVGVGCVLVLPAAFALPRDDGSRMYDEAAFLLVLRRDTERLCSLTVCNTGAGLEWHPSRIDAADGSALRNATLRLSEVPRDRLTDSAFWYLLYRELFAPKAASADPGTRGPGCLYGRLLPAR